ncbi:hypothetical protein [Neoroseomonas lacus]|uniref:DUF3592 domain-containing protein n=1 Tax=Neoroseomonas lacus TaxID=287609 RepID=A0A917KY50_9PROT|nr:hypothetical protein [Neoroseomonas lacus]GGJ32829.1 hypothetical protein GCM10011320_45610 [Neoroseomonas lacus]
MDAATSGLLLWVLAAVLLRRDLRGVYRRLRWRRAVARITFLPTETGPSWRIDFTLPDGAPVSVVTRDLRMIARREQPGPVRLLYDPAAPSRMEMPGRPGLGSVVGVALAVLGIAQVLR